MQNILKSFVKSLLQADMTQEELEEYLASDLSKMPDQWLQERNGQASDAEMKEYLTEKFPEE